MTAVATESVFKDILNKIKLPIEKEGVKANMDPATIAMIVQLIVAITPVIIEALKVLIPIIIDAINKGQQQPHPTAH